MTFRTPGRHRSARPAPSVLLRPPADWRTFSILAPALLAGVSLALILGGTLLLH